MCDSLFGPSWIRRDQGEIVARNPEIKGEVRKETLIIKCFFN